MLSFWEQQSFIKYDYLIVGSGIVGLSTAASIKEKEPQATVLVLERGIFPTGASTKNAGFGCFGSVTELLSDIDVMGEENVVKLVTRRWKGLHKLEQRLGAEGIGRKNFGGTELLLKDKKYKDLNERALANIESINRLLTPVFGKKVFEQLPTQKIADLGFDASQVAHLIFTPFEFQIHTGDMMRALLEYTMKLGIKIINGCEVSAIEDQGNRVTVHTKGHVSASEVGFEAKKVAVCTNGFTRKLLPDLDIQPGRGIVMVTEPIEGLPFKGTYHFDEGYYYFRNFGERIIFGGGRNLDKATETTTDFDLNKLITQDLIEKLTHLILPHQPFEVAHTWAGIMAFGGQGKTPILQPVSDNVMVGTRLNGMGVALGSTLGEEIAAELI
ncbi:MAG TPA: FAD-dependent oxidoreductase [Microscillaceae bacterium]|nr:FAD-dependent oxidoreductase [Microscillaceae bacterium]